MKKEYMKPAMRVVKLHQQSCILSGSNLKSVAGNASLNYVGGGNVTARSRSFDGWNDGWDEE